MLPRYRSCHIAILEGNGTFAAKAILILFGYPEPSVKLVHVVILIRGYI